MKCPSSDLTFLTCKMEISTVASQGCFEIKWSNDPALSKNLTNNIYCYFKNIYSSLKMY